MPLGALGATHGRTTTIQPTNFLQRRSANIRRGSAGGGGGGMGDLSSLIEQLMASSNSANDANEARYQEGKGLLDQLGVAGQEDIKRSASRQTAEGNQNLASRGLSGTTIGQGNSNQIAANAQLNSQKLKEAVAAKKLGFIERKTDAGPDLSLLLQLIQMNAASGGF